MSLINDINNDLKSALKGGRDLELQVLRGLNAALHNKSIEKRGRGEGEDLTNEEVAGALGKELKKRKEAIELYHRGGRPELVNKENQEAAIIQKYLPEQMSDDEIEKVVERVLDNLEEKDFGKAMKIAMTELKGKVDGKRVAEIIRAKLETRN